MLACSHVSRNLLQFYVFRMCCGILDEIYIAINANFAIKCL